ncbi:YfiR family protein [bacterium]|nr:YfiR family protein [bacterium]
MSRRFNYKSQSRKRVILCFLFMLFGEIIPGFSQPSEYLLKAVFIEKFTRFIEWPECHQLEDSSKSFIIGILGENPFDVNLAALYKNQKIKNKPVEIRHFRQVDNIRGCDLLFISKSEKNHIQQIVDYLDEKPVLTVGDSDALSGKGVIINMFVSDNKIRFEIDERAMNRAGFRVSYLLLKEAVIVNSNRDMR